MTMRLQSFMEYIFYWSGMIQTGNNHLRLDVTQRIKEVKANDVIALTQEMPDWKERLEDGFDKIQDANDSISEIGAALDGIMAERDPEGSYEPPFVT